MIVTHGGMVGGYGLYVRDGKPTFVYNFLGLERFTFAGQGAVAEGQGEAGGRFHLRRRSGRARQGRDGDAAVNGKKVAEGKLPKTIPLQISLGEGMDIGMDVGSPWTSPTSCRSRSRARSTRSRSS